MLLRFVGIVSLILMAPTLTGCAQKAWTKHGATTESFNNDKYSCERDARQSGYFGGGIIGGLNMQDFYNRCMNSKGWTLADKKQTDLQNATDAQMLKSSTSIMKECKQKIRDNPKYSGILVHMNDLNSGEFSFSQMANTQKPSHKESQTLTDYFNEQDSCRKTYLATISPILSETQQKAIDARVEEGDVNGAKLVRSEISYGEWATKENQSSSELKNKFKQ
ncbi:hypothetical protein [Acetobacter sp.]|uniref:hypothetical protein n=1 Tax=Acetobacter sp. TaxID=440 RepID=UPI0025862AC0|nr:hypothetical protein [Acetobacter sp.]MCC6105614.1 hypothetical protein [Acetobacter sp.]